MNIYLIKMVDVDYDEYRGFVVQAINEEEAKKLCGITVEKKDDNLYEANIEIIKIVGINKDKKQKVILSDYRAG